MAEKKVFAQIDVLGSNQTPMDAFIYMEDQGGGGGSGKDVDLTPYLEFDDPENPNPRKFKITQEGYDIIYNAWHNHEDNVYKFAVGTDFVFAAKVSKTDAFGESTFWMEGSFFGVLATYLVTDNLDVKLVNPMDITSNIEVRVEESGPVAVLDGTVLQQIVNDFQAGNNRVYIVNSLLLGLDDPFDILFKVVGYDNLTRTLALNACFNGYSIIQAKIDADGRIAYRLISGFIGDFGDGAADPQLPTLNWIEINDRMYKVGKEATLDDIVDVDGNKMFVSGDISMNNVPASNRIGTSVTQTYAKWCLSGKHLMIVVAGYVPYNQSTRSSGYFTWGINFPQYIQDKIFSITGSNQRGSSSNNIVSKQSFYFFSSAGDKIENGDFECRLFTSGHIEMSHGTVIPYSSDPSNHKYFRVQFDLIID